MNIDMNMDKSMDRSMDVTMDSNKCTSNNGIGIDNTALGDCNSERSKSNIDYDNISGSDSYSCSSEKSKMDDMNSVTSSFTNLDIIKSNPSNSNTNKTNTNTNTSIKTKTNTNTDIII